MSWNAVDCVSVFKKCQIIVHFLSPKHCTYFRVSPNRWRCKDFSWFLSFILSQNKSPYSCRIPVSQRERAHGRRRRKKPKEPLPHGGMLTHNLNLLTRALYPLYHGPLPCLERLHFREELEMDQATGSCIFSATVKQRFLNICKSVLFCHSKTASVLSLTYLIYL